MTSGADRIAVIIPAYNAAATIDETLLSVRNQSHADLEIVVVDDGSSDATAQIAARHAERDPRVRVIVQDNAGVAAARNRGIAETAAPYIAPVDADDLWHSHKMERQLRVLRAGGSDTGLVYSWNALIDGSSRVTSLEGTASHAGDVLRMLCYGNFVGNGSSSLMRRAALLAAGGFDPSLRARKAQGCEDWKLFLAISESHLFGVVPDHLTGYRQSAGAMSGDVSQMLRSDALVREEFAERHPEHAGMFVYGRQFYLQWLLRRETSATNWNNVSRLMKELGEHKPGRLRAAVRMARLAGGVARARIGRRTYGALGRPFLPDAT